MKKQIAFFFAVASILVSVTACEKDKVKADLPAEVADVTVTPRVGGVVIKWTRPTTGTYEVLKVGYTRNGVQREAVANNKADSIQIFGLLNKLEYGFKVQTFNVDGAGSSITTLDPVKPILRPTVVINDPAKWVAIPLDVNIIDAYTQETSEGPKSNLVDGDPNTYWHSAWSSNVQPFPHWIQINFSEEKKIGGFRFYFRNSNGTSARPKKWDIQTSSDGITWTTVWTSQEKASTVAEEKSVEQFITFPENYTSKYFRFRILKVFSATANWTNLGEFAVFTTSPITLDQEKIAEQNYN